jgi:serine/threonine protein phosphatase 1
MNFLRRLLGPESRNRSPRSPEGHRIYAIGDVHGRDDLLADLLERIEADGRERGPARHVLVFLGDLIDRGPASAAVVDLLRTYRLPGARMVFLCGNHEEVLLRILDGEIQLVPDWLKFGGAECAASYGIDPAALRRMPARQVLDTIRSAVPDDHVSFLRTFDDTFRAGDYLFVHAGVRPGIAVEEQAPGDLRWIREPFLSDRAEHGYVVVHGHTIRADIETRHNRIGIDTGAYRTGVLTALGLERDERWFLQAKAEADVQVEDRGNKANSSALDGVSSQSG